MMNLEEYHSFLETKKTKVAESGFDIAETDLNPLLFPFQKYCVKKALKCGKYALFENTGLGKEQPYSEPVLTPDGFVEMGSLRVGDMVIARNGKPTKITAIYEQGEKDVYRVSFSDGTSTRCGIDHLWAVRNRNEANKNKPFRTMPLRDIIKTYKRRVVDKRYPDAERWDYRYQIPVCGAVQFNTDIDFDNRLHPYLLGVIIGDGCISQHTVRICKPNPEIHRRVKLYAPKEDVVSDFLKDGMSFTIYNPVTNQKSKTKELLEELGLMGLRSKEKFIPSTYLFAPQSIRESLLAGLVDTDGHLIGDTLIEYSTASERLCNDVCFLARSLGYIVRAASRESYYERDGERFKNWRIYIYRTTARKIKTITDICLVGREQSRCIMVNDEEHCYLTRDFIVTHNTIQQLEWAKQVHLHTGGNVLIIAPLAVVGQTIMEGEKFGYKVNRGGQEPTDGISITNYDQIPNIAASDYVGIVLDESSILKNFDGETKKLILETFRETPYKLACTATPSPNDVMELGNHAEFLDAMSRNEMLAMYFVHDGGNTSSWRLKGHCEQLFWDFVSEWATMIEKPSDIGFSDDGYILPPLNIIEEIIKTEKRDNGLLFNDMAVNATDYNGELRATVNERLGRVAEIVNGNPEDNFIVWIKQDGEGDILRNLIPDCVEVRGSEKPEVKEEKLLGFGQNKFRVLVTKLKIAQFGMNYQNCHNQIFASLDFSFESTYQGIRRSYRFGQEHEVNIHLICTDTMQNVRETINRKQAQFETMQRAMTVATNRNVRQREKLKKVESRMGMVLPSFI